MYSITNKTRIAVVGETWGAVEEQKGRGFAGPGAGVLRGLLSQVGIEPQEVYLTNVFNFRPPSNKIEELCGTKSEGIPNYRPIIKSRYIRAEYQGEIDRLFSELEQINPHLIIALGNAPLWAICKKVGVKKYRGSPLLSHCGRWKVLPTWHPNSILRQWELRATTLADFFKAAHERHFPELRRPSRLIYLDPTLEDIDDFYNEFLRDEPWISCDIETKAMTITEVGYANAAGNRAIVIPFWRRSAPNGNYWPTLPQEREAWNKVRMINREKKLVGQNFSYDMQYFWRTVGIPCPQVEGDTMLLHHSLQPELEKGLGYLGSIYTNEPSWKFMRTDHSTLKKGDE